MPDRDALTTIAGQSAIALVRLDAHIAECNENHKTVKEQMGALRNELSWIFRTTMLTLLAIIGSGVGGLIVWLVRVRS